MTQSKLEIAGSTRFFSGLLGDGKFYFPFRRGGTINSPGFSNGKRRGTATLYKNIG
jgi:hypothetical protein